MMFWTKRVLAATLMIALLAAPAFAENLTRTAASLEMGFSARNLAMGGAGAAASPDASAVYYNPAALAFHTGTSLVSGYSKDWLQVSRFAGAYAAGSLGGGIMRMTSSGIEIRDAYGNVEGTFGLSEQAVMGGFGWKMGETAGAGLTAKQFSQSLSAKTGNGLTVDAGLIWKNENVSVGAVGRNLIGSVKYSDGSVDRFDSQVVFGIEVRTEQFRGLIDLETNGTAHLGAEYRVGKVALRGGVFGDEAPAITMGFGMVLDNGMSVDYAYVAPPHIDPSHRVSVVLGF